MAAQKMEGSDVADGSGVAQVSGATDRSGLEGDTYLSRGEAARRLGVPPRTIQEWARDGRLPCIRTLGGHRRFSLRDIDALADQVKKRRARRRPVPQTPQ